MLIPDTEQTAGRIVFVHLHPSGLIESTENRTVGIVGSSLKRCAGRHECQIVQPTIQRRQRYRTQLTPRRKKGRCQTAVMNNRKWIQFARYPQSRHRYDIRSTKDLYSSTCIWHTGTDGPYRLRDTQPMPNLNPHSPIQFLLRPEKKDQKEGLYKRSVQPIHSRIKGEIFILRSPLFKYIGADRQKLSKIIFMQPSHYRTGQAVPRKHRYGCSRRFRSTADRS